MAGPPSSAVAQEQRFELREQLNEDVQHRVERSMEVQLDRATLVYGTQGMTAGFRTKAATWVRVQWRRPGMVWRADDMELISHPVINSTGVIATEPELPESWWATLKTSLAALGEQKTERFGVRQDHLTLRINQVFPNEIDTQVDEWVTAHADLHWGNLTAPECYLLDWEDWGAAPRGRDAVTLWGHSLLVPPLAERVQREFRTDLRTRSGKLAQLLFCSNVIRVNTKRTDPSPLLEPARRAADALLTELRE